MINNLLETISEAEVLQIALFLVLLTFILILILLKSIFFVRIIKLKKPVRSEKGTPFSILLTARNEEDNISENLPHLLSNEIADYEVVVVDDFSQDNSLYVLGKLREANPKLKVSSLNEQTRFSEKLSQSIAIKSAKKEWVVFIPLSFTQITENWFENIFNSISPNSDAVISYCNVIESDSFFNTMYRAETFLLYLKSMRHSIAGFPYVYFEDNVMFRKDRYFELGGYGKKINEPYANLELLINQFMQKGKFSFVLNRESAIRFSDEISRDDFFDLIKKSFRIDQYLSSSKKIMLLLNSVVDLSVLPLAIAVIILFTGVWPIVLFGLSLVSILHLLIIKTMQNRLNERKIFITSLVYELIMPYFKIVFRWYFNRKSQRQNGRAKFKII